MKRVVGWLVFVAALVGLGAVIHAGTPSAPRWSARVEGLRVIRAAFRGDQLITMRLHSSAPNGPLEVRDVTTGKILWRGWEDGARARCFGFSRGGRWAAGVAGRGGSTALR